MTQQDFHLFFVCLILSNWYFEAPKGPYLSPFRTQISTLDDTSSPSAWSWSTWFSETPKGPYLSPFRSQISTLDGTSSPSAWSLSTPDFLKSQKILTSALSGHRFPPWSSHLLRVPDLEYPVPDFMTPQKGPYLSPFSAQISTLEGTSSPSAWSLSR
jgi:hypothetical protein